MVNSVFLLFNFLEKSEEKFMILLQIFYNTFSWFNNSVFINFFKKEIHIKFLK